MSIVQAVSQIWTADDVLFAPVRAMRGDAREYVDELLAAASAPGRLDGVTPAQVRICAAQILLHAGDLDAALRTGSEALAAAAPADLGARERFTLAQIFVAAGDADRAVDLAAEALTGKVTYVNFGSRIALILQLAEAGRFDHALRLCDAPVRRATAGALGSRIGQLLELTRQQVLAIQAEAEAAGPDFRFITTTPAPDAARAAAATPPAWPAVVDGHLGWWPEREYPRIVRQVPELGTILGDTWRQHTSRTESALRASSRRGEHGLKLVAQYFDDFVDYLIRRRADPGDATVLTDIASKSSHGRAWPPTGRDSCWCGSGRRYRDCCGRPD